MTRQEQKAVKELSEMISKNLKVVARESMASKWFQTAPIRSWVIFYMKCFYQRPLSGVGLP